MPGDTVKVLKNHTGGGNAGSWYQYISQVPGSINRGMEDLSDRQKEFLGGTFVA
jgi:hypothetical protein